MLFNFSVSAIYELKTRESQHLLWSKSLQSEAQYNNYKRANDAKLSALRSLQATLSTRLLRLGCVETDLSADALAIWTARMNTDCSDVPRDAAAGDSGGGEQVQSLKRELAECLRALRECEETSLYLESMLSPTDREALAKFRFTAFKSTPVPFRFFLTSFASFDSNFENNQ